MELVSSDSQQSPYYINAADLSSGAVVTPELTEGNYASWRRSFELAMSIKNKAGFIDGTIPRPEPDNRLYPTWKRCDDLVRTWLQRSVSPAIATTIFYLHTAREAWEELQERFGEPDESRICRLQLQYHSLVQGSKSVSDFYNEMLGLLRELREYRPYPKCKCGKCDCGWEKSYADELQKDMVYKFLNGLDREYGALRSQILLRKPFPTLGEAYNILQREEMQRSMKEEQVSLFGNSIAVAVKREVAGSDQGSLLAFAEKGKFRPETSCEHCGKKGHLKSRCYHLIGFPPNQMYGRGRGQPFYKQQGMNNRRMVNAVESKQQQPTDTNNKQSPHIALSDTQVQRLMALLSVESPNQSAPTAQQGQHTSYPLLPNTINHLDSFAGLAQLDDDWTS